MNQKKIIALTALIIVGILAAICFYTSVAATVGDTKIYKSDAAYRDQIVKVYFPQEKRSLGLYQLMKSMTNLQILKNNGVVFDDAKVEDEEKRIDKATRDPAKLQVIKNIFRGDMAAYRRDYILPTLADRTIYYDFFLNNAEIHKESLNKATAFITEATKKPDTFKTLAQLKTLDYQTLVVSLKDGLLWGGKKTDQKAANPLAALQGNSKKGQPDHDEQGKYWIDTFIQPHKPGDVIPEPIDFGETWAVLRYLHPSSHRNTYDLEVASVRKSDYNAWFEKEKAKVAIKISDKSYKAP